MYQNPINSEASGKTLVHFGAGNIGRSLVGQIFSRAGWRVIFIDPVAEIIEALNARGGYLVRVKDVVAHDIWVDKVSGIHLTESRRVLQALINADMVSTAVGPSALEGIFPIVAAAVSKRTESLVLMLCENLHGIKEFVLNGLKKQFVEDPRLIERIGIVATSIGKMVPIMPAGIRAIDPLEVWAEEYNLIIADREGFINNPPNIEGLVLKSNFDAYVERKLFIHNLGHAAAAYLGFQKQKTYIWECMEDAEIKNRVYSVMMESAEALINKFPDEFNPINQSEHINDLLFRFGNKALGDTVYRVGRDLRRKLAHNDRCIGALRLMIEYGVKPYHIYDIVAAGLLFEAKNENGVMFEGDAEFQFLRRQNGIDDILVRLCGLDPAQDLEIVAKITESYRAMLATH